MKKVVIVHGWEGSPDSNWFPWLKRELEKLGHEVVIPAMPNPDFPVMGEWIKELRRAVGTPSEDVYLVGHSLGVITILRYLESLAESERVGGAVLVAGFPEPIGYRELDNFLETPLDYEKVKRAAQKFVAIHSDNDPYVPLRNGELLRDNLGAKLVIIHGGGHLNAGDGFGEFPVVLEKLQEI